MAVVSPMQTAELMDRRPSALVVLTPGRPMFRIIFKEFAF
jgi:hypothetical protein